MKLNSISGNTSVVIGGMTENKFGIIANDKMYNILSNGIYVDKIKAPIRELATNAYDAHVSCNKKDIPFLVHIPQKDEPYFSIRDYGEGLDSNQIETLYTTYGWSNKNDSNKYVGCLGLGSKSPFSYTDSFEIHSVKNSKKYIYRCFMDCGIPCVMKFDEYDTVEESGMLIKFDVKEFDIHEFFYKSLSVFKWFKVKPITNVSFDYPEFKIEDGVIINGEEGILMGNVFYPSLFLIHDYIVKNKLESQDDNFINFILNHQYRNLTICASIGDYDIAVSREEISQINKNEEKAYLFLRQWYEKQQIKIKEHIDKFKGNDIEKYLELIKIKNSKSWINVADWSKNTTIDFYNNGKHTFLSTNIHKKCSLKKINIKCNIPSWTKQMIPLQCVTYSPNGTCKKIYQKYVVDNHINLLVTSDKNICDKIVSMGIKQLDLSNYQYVKENKVEKLDGVLYNYDFINNKHRCTCSKYTIKTALEEYGAIFYIPFYNNRPDGNIAFKMVDDWICVLKNFFKKPIFISYRNETKTLKDTPKCFNVLELMNNIFKDFNKFNHIKYLCNFSLTTGEKSFFNNIKLNKNLMENNVVNAYDIINKNCQVFDYYKEYHSLNRHEKIFLNLFSSFNNYGVVKSLNDYVYKNFPLLTHIIGWNKLTNDDIKNIQEYVELIENKKIMEKNNE